MNIILCLIFAIINTDHEDKNADMPKLRNAY